MKTALKLILLKMDADNYCVTSLNGSVIINQSPTPLRTTASKLLMDDEAEPETWLFFDFKGCVLFPHAAKDYLFIDYDAQYLSPPSVVPLKARRRR